MEIQHKDATITEPDSGDEMPGSFEAILSTPSVDRDGDELKSEDWLTPLPTRIPIDVDHGMSVVSTVGSAEPYFNEAGNLAIRGIFASTPLAQEVRTLVKEGHISSVSVGFMTHRDTKAGGKPGKRELLNAGIVNTPSNRDAIMLAAKGLIDSKAGARHSAADMSHIQAIADHARALGAAGPEDDTQAAEGTVAGKASKPDFTPIPDGTHVSWHYRSAIGHGTIVGVHVLGTSNDTTEYSIAEHDHHVSESGSRESAIVYHFGSALTVTRDDGKAAGDVEVKAKYTAEQSRQMLADGHAIANENGDPSYEIGDLADLRRAVHAVGRGSGDHDKVRAYIIRRAKELDAADEIPEDWNADGSIAAEKRYARLVAAKAVDGSYEQREQAICDALTGRYPGDDVWAYSLATFDDTVVYRVSSPSDLLRGQWQAPYTYADGVVTLGEPERVDMVEQIVPAKSYTTKALGDPDHTVTEIAQAVDAALDEVSTLLDDVDVSALPEPVRQALGLVTAAGVTVDELLDAMGVDDPDDDDDEVTGDQAPAAAGKAAPAADVDDLDMQYRAMSLQLAAYTAD